MLILTKIDFQRKYLSLREELHLDKVDRTYHVTPDGIPVTNRLDTTTERKLYAMVVDNILNSTTLISRFMGNAKEFRGKTMDYTIKVVNSQAGQWIQGAENLGMAASDTTVTMSFSDAAFEQPIVIPMIEAFANQGPEGTIDLSMFKVDEAYAEGINRVGQAAYGTGANKQILGLEGIDDDGTNNGTIGGQSRTTYTTLKSTNTASGGTVSFAKLGTLEDATRAASMNSERFSLWVTTKANWTYIEQLHMPQVVGTYEQIGYQYLPVRGAATVSAADLKGASGFTALTYRGKPIIDDDNCTANNIYGLNERYIFFLGRAIVPSLFRSFLEKVNLGKPRTIEGPGGQNYMGMPSPYNGWFFQKMQISPSQAVAVARLWVIGQMATNQPRRLGKLTGVTGI